MKSIPADMSKQWSPIGVQIQPVTAEIADSLGLKNTQGALVAEPQSGSRAQKAGIKAGDVIVSVNGETVTDARDLARRIGTMAPGAIVKLGITRNGRADTVTVTFGQLPGIGQRVPGTRNARRPVPRCPGSVCRSRPPVTAARASW